MTDQSDICDSLPGRTLPSVVLPSTHVALVDLSSLPARAAIFAYPQTSPPDGSSSPGSAEPSEAKDCTPLSCGLRDFHAEFLSAGVNRVFDLSTHRTDHQRQACRRLHLPMFSAGDMTLLERFAMVLDDRTVTKVFHPVATSAKHAAEVFAHID